MTKALLFSPRVEEDFCLVGHAIVRHACARIPEESRGLSREKPKRGFYFLLDNLQTMFDSLIE